MNCPHLPAADHLMPDYVQILASRYLRRLRPLLPDPRLRAPGAGSTHQAVRSTSYSATVSGVMWLVLLCFLHFVVVSGEQLVDRCRARGHLPGGSAY
jgi:hypothetical protein